MHEQFELGKPRDKSLVTLETEFTLLRLFGAKLHCHLSSSFYDSKITIATLISTEFVSVTLTPQTADLVEVNSSVSLSCSLTGLSVVYWMNGSSQVAASDSVQINATERGSTLTILNVTRYDQGIYKCQPPCPSITELPEVNISVSCKLSNMLII